MANDGAISVLVEHMNKIIFRTGSTMVLPLTTASMHTDENKKTKNQVWYTAEEALLLFSHGPT